MAELLTSDEVKESEVKESGTDGGKINSSELEEGQM